jgi:hypothetical protein
MIAIVASRLIPFPFVAGLPRDPNIGQIRATLSGHRRRLLVPDPASNLYHFAQRIFR